MNKVFYKKIYWVVALLFFGLTASSQVLIKGKIADKKGNPVQGASVSVIDADNRIVNGTSTDIEGNFVLKNVKSDLKKHWKNFHSFRRKILQKKCRSN